MDIIASIHDKYFQLIKSGDKTIEVRKNIPKQFIAHRGDCIYWYNTKTKKIEGKSIFAVAETINFNSDDWATHEEKGMEKYTCVTFDNLQLYQNDSKLVWLWYLGDFEPLDIKLPQGKKGPQSWCYKYTIFHPLIAINPNFNKEQ